MRSLRQRLGQELDRSAQRHGPCPRCGQWTVRGTCSFCGSTTTAVSQPQGLVAGAPLLVRLRRELHRTAAQFTNCPRCGQWTVRGQCTYCGTGGGQEAAQPPRWPALVRWHPGEQAMLLLSILKWLALGSLVGVLAGTASAVFLVALEWATATREAHPYLLWALPLAGVAVAWLYARFGQGAERGNNLILDTIHRLEGRVPARMAPLVLLGTVVTHLFGGSAGREGTAVQMGGSLADTLARRLRLSPADRRLMLMAGVSGGFGSVFGTPLAGTVFGMEVLRVGAIRYDAFVACLAAAFVGDRVTTAWGVHHGHYPVTGVPDPSLGVLAKVALAGVAFGLAALLFAELAHGFKAAFRTLVPWPLLRPVAGGLAVAGLTLALGTRAYLGLGVPMIQRSFTPDAVPPLAFFWKTLFTAITLGSGFQGGEVTPLFFVGATLGHALAAILHLPPGFLAALGFVAVFAGAANTPLTCILMGAELFGAAPLPYVGIACVISYVFSGHRGIYTAQRIEAAKSKSVPVPQGAPLQVVHEALPPLLGRPE